MQEAVESKVVHEGLNGMGTDDWKTSDELALVRKLEVRLSALAVLRKVSTFPASLVPSRKQLVIAELRGSNLMLSSLSHSYGDFKLHSRRAVVSALQRKRIKQSSSQGRQQQEKTPIVIPLGSVEISPRVYSVRHALLIRPLDNAKPFELQLRDERALRSWMAAVQESSSPRAALRLDDLRIVSPLGAGAFAQVFLAQNTTTNDLLALKVMEKRTVFQCRKTFRHTVDERLVMERACDHPFLLKLLHAFQTDTRLYLALEYCVHGDLYEYMRARGSPLTELQARRVIAQILLALEHLHARGALYRDLKLENTLLHADGYIRLADFGLSKLVREPSRLESSRDEQTDLHQHRSVDSHMSRLATRSSSTANTVCGTSEYLAPEMFEGTGYGASVDLWALGVLLYELVCGSSPFYSKDPEKLLELIFSRSLNFPSHVSENVIDLLSRLLDRNVSNRLGAGPEGIAEVKAHPFFDGLDWDDLLAKVPHEDDLPMLPAPIQERVPREAAEIPPDIEQDLQSERAWVNARVRTALQTSLRARSTAAAPRSRPISRNSTKRSLVIAGYTLSSSQRTATGTLEDMCSEVSNTQLLHQSSHDWFRSVVSEHSDDSDQGREQQQQEEELGASHARAENHGAH